MGDMAEFAVSVILDWRDITGGRYVQFVAIRLSQFGFSLLPSCEDFTSLIAGVNMVGFSYHQPALSNF
jgi:hypothetical protein